MEPALEATVDSPPVYTPGPTEPILPAPSTGQPTSTINFNAYRVPNSVLSNDRTLLTTTESVYLNDSKALVNLLSVQMALPPRPVLRISGQHSEWGPEYGKDKVDFDLTLELTGSPGLSNAGVQQVATDGDKGQKREKGAFLDDVEALATRFCADRSGSKSVSLKRTISNWDHEHLEGQIRSLVASTGYAGKVTVWIGPQYSQLLCRTPVAGDTAIIPSKLKNAICTSLDMPLTSAPPTPATLGQDPSTNRYEAPTVTWHYATAPPNVGNRQALVQDEREFWRAWQAAIRNCVLNGRQGRVTELDRVDAAMGETAAAKEKGWGKSSQW